MYHQTRPELLDPTEAAAFLGVAGPHVLAVWRSTKRYPIPYIKVGKCVRYAIDDLVAFLESRKIHPEPAQL